MPQARTKEDDRMKITVLYFGQLKEEAARPAKAWKLMPRPWQSSMINSSKDTV